MARARVKEITSHVGPLAAHLSTGRAEAGRQAGLAAKHLPCTAPWDSRCVTGADPGCGAYSGQSCGASSTARSQTPAEGVWTRWGVGRGRLVGGVGGGGGEMADAMLLPKLEVKLMYRGEAIAVA